MSSKFNLASLIAKYEGKKHNAPIGDIREILKIIDAIDAVGHAFSFPAWQISSTAGPRWGKHLDRAEKYRDKGMTKEEALDKVLGVKA